MERYYHLLIFCLLCLESFAQPNLSFANGMGSGMSTDRASSIYTDPTGNSFLTGGFSGISDFDPSAGTATVNSIGQEDIFVAKYNSNGLYQWVFAIGGSSKDEGYSINVDAFGDIYITGHFTGIVDFDPSVNVANLSSNGGGDIFVAKYTSNGTYLWAIRMGGILDDKGLGLSNDAQGNCYVTGYYQDTVDFNPSVASFTLPSTGQDAFAAKYDANGVFQWALHPEGAAGDVGNGIKCDASGNCYVTGSFGISGDFDPSPNTALLITPSNNKNSFLAKYDGNGNYLWAFNINSGLLNQANSIALDAGGNIYLTGFVQGGGLVVDFDPSSNSTTFTPPYSAPSGFVAKYNNMGSYQWAFLIGDGFGVNTGYSISADNSGNCFVTGLVSSPTDFDPSPAVANVLGAGFDYVFVVKYSTNGQYQWVFKLGITNYPVYNYNQSIANDLAGNTYVVGPRSFVNEDFDPTLGTYTVTASSMFFAKYSSCGAPTAPTALTNTLNQIVCANTSASLSAIGTGTISWFASTSSTLAIASGTSFTTPALSAGIYTFFAGAETCTNSIFRTPVTITVNSLPSISINNPAPSICQGQSSTLTASGATTYTWNNQFVSPFIVATPTGNLTYTVTGTDSNNCINSSVTTVTVELCTALDKLSGGCRFLLYPIPAQEQLSLDVIEGGNETYFSNYEIVNSSGQVLRTGGLTWTEKKSLINLRQLPNGIYFIQLFGNGIASVNRPIVISR